MEDSEDFDAIQVNSNAIRDDVPSSGDDQLACAVDSAGTAKGRILAQKADGVMDTLDQCTGCGRILPGNMLCFVVQIP